MSEKQNQNQPGGPGIYREKSLQKISSPEQLNDYIRVTSPSVWIVLAATVALLIGIIGWSIFGTVEAHDAAGNVQQVHPITYVTN